MSRKSALLRTGIYTMLAILMATPVSVNGTSMIIAKTDALNSLPVESPESFLFGFDPQEMTMDTESLLQIMLTEDTYNIQEIVQEMNRLDSTIALDAVLQSDICGSFRDKDLDYVSSRFEAYGTTILESFHKVECQKERTHYTDPLKYMMQDSLGKSNLASFILYYKKAGRLDDLTKMFNRVVPGPEKPTGTLIDFIEFYKTSDGLGQGSRDSYDSIIKLLRRFGALKESEL